MQQSLQSAPEIQALKKQYEVSDLSRREANAQLDWNLTVDVGKDRDRQVSLTNRNFDLEQSDLISSTLKKSFQTGTDVSLDLRSEKLKSTATFLAAPRDGSFHSYLFTLEQNFWRDAFGKSLRASLRAADTQSESYKMQGAEDLEQALIKGAELYWTAAIANRRKIESEAALKRYEGLVKNIENKARVRYAAPGELSQVRAEFFSRQKSAKLNHLEFEQAYLNLKIFLPVMSEEKWNLPQDVPNYSSQMKMPTTQLENSRAYKIAELKREQKRFETESLVSANQPKIALVGQVGATGVNSTFAESQQQMIEGTRPFWYVGVRFSHSFGSDVHTARIHQSKAQLFAQEIRTKSALESLRQSQVLLEKNVQILESNLKVQQQLLEARRAAVQELTRTFNQGRTDISILIDAINRAEDSEVEQVRVRADLELAFMQWQSLTDQLNLE